jgi:hypothetical protein
LGLDGFWASLDLPEISPIFCDMQMRLAAQREEEAREELTQARYWILFFFTFEFDVSDFRSIELNFLPVYRPCIFEKKPLLFFFLLSRETLDFVFFYF